MARDRRYPPVRPPWSWPGVVAVVIAASLGAGWCGALIISAAIPEPVSQDGLSLLDGLGQTLAGALAAYLGYQIGTARSETTGRDYTVNNYPTDPTRRGDATPPRKERTMTEHPEHEPETPDAIPAPDEAEPLEPGDVGHDDEVGASTVDEDTVEDTDDARHKRRPDVR